MRDGICEPVPHTEFAAWKALSGNIVYSTEYAILRDMDVAFCEETNKELADFRERERDRSDKK